MSVFVVVSTRASSKIKESIESNIEEGSFQKLNNEAWMVSYNGTSLDLSKKLGIKDGVAGAGVVFLVANFSGYASTYIWEWLNKHPEARSE